MDYSNIYKLYLVRNYALEYSKNMESLDRYKLNYKYGNVDVIGKLFWSLFICNDEDFEKIEEVIKSVVNFDDVSFLRKSCSKIEKFGLELMCIENEDVQIIGELVKSRLKLYLDELSFKTNNNFTNKYEELERCYQICIDCEWNIYKIKKVASRKGIVLVINKAREFAICKLHLTNEQFKVLINNSNRNSTNKKYQELIDRIVYEKNDDKIFEIIQQT